MVLPRHRSEKTPFGTFIVKSEGSARFSEIWSSLDISFSFFFFEKIGMWKKMYVYLM